MTGECPHCGRPLDEHNRHVRFRLPDPVVDSPDQEATTGTWLSEPDPNRAVMMQVPGVGAFVRCLLPVRLDGGYTVTFGVWVAVEPDELQRIFKVWWAPEYADTVIDGWLANALPVWGLLSAPVVARVVDPDATPYVTESSDSGLAAVLGTEWPHDEVLRALP